MATRICCVTYLSVTAMEFVWAHVSILVFIGDASIYI